MDLLNSNESIINSQIIRGITEIGFSQLTPIQEQAIPVLLDGEDIIGQAQTGTGKTAAFGIPLIQKIDPEDSSVQGLVLCPTRELAIQASDELRKFARYLHGVKILPIYGGTDISRQIKALRGKISIVVGTPGRVMDHMRRHTLKLGNLKMLVLDEADEMLNMGFREDIETILRDIPSEHQTALFSATMPQAILDITKKYLREDAKIIKVVKKELTMSTIKQYYYEVNTNNKNEVAARILDYYAPKRTLVFCNTKTMVDKLCEYLKRKGYLAEGLHGDLSQHQRDKVMNSFRNGTSNILIATDVAARGIDVDDVEAVINYDIPQDIEYYVHRIGRTGRAGREGRAFTLVVGREIYRIREIERVCKTKMTKREIPSVKEVKNAKANKVFEAINKIIEEEDLSGILPLIEAKIEETGESAVALAAALLKSHMGEEPEEIVIEKYTRGRNSYGRRDNGGSFGQRGYVRGGRGVSRDEGRGYNRGGRGKSGEDRRNGERGRDYNKGSYGSYKNNDRRNNADTGRINKRSERNRNSLPNNINYKGEAVKRKSK
jgi:ATP-dependent RNA helicase DeaD